MFGFIFSSNDIAIAIGGDTVWIAEGPKGPVTGMPAYVAQTAGKVCAAGEDARRLLGKEPGNLFVTRVSNLGGFGDATLSIAFIRYLLAKSRGFWSLPPRVVVACSQAAKVKVFDVLTKAGARKVISIPPSMAAAIGAGLPIDTPAFQTVFCLERDWCSFAVISLNGIVAAFELAGGIELLLEDIAIHALATRGVELDMEKLHDALLSKGIVGSDLLGWEAWIGELETGRASIVSATNNDLLRSAIPFTLRIDRRYRQAMERLDGAKRRESAGSPVHLFGPYATLPGVADLISRAFSRKVVVTDKPEEAMVRGGQKVLADLSQLIKGAR